MPAIRKHFWLDSFVPVTESGCWIWLGMVDACGYGKYYDSKLGGKVMAHRLSFVRNVGDIPPGLHVLHRCDVPACINPAHLFLGTAADNAADKVRKGRHPVGERTYQARLTETDVRAIRASPDVSLKQLAQTYGVSPKTISSVRGRENWRHI